MLCRGGEELLIKWEGLGYDELSWERRASLKEVDAKIAAFKGRQSIATKVTHVKDATRALSQSLSCSRPEVIPARELQRIQAARQL